MQVVLASIGMSDPSFLNDVDFGEGHSGVNPRTPEFFSTTLMQTLSCKCLLVDLFELLLQAADIQVEHRRASLL